MSQFSSEISYSKFKNLLNLRSTTTVQKYIRYLEEAYLFFSINRFSPDYGRYMENIVAIELTRRGYRPNKNLFYYKTRNHKEIDFITRDGLKITKIIQVAYQLEEKTKKREFSALKEAKEELDCHDTLMITWNSLADWLLNKE